MALPTGFPPASFRLEDGCLMYSTTAAFKLVSAERFALPITPSRTENVAATPRAVAPANGWRRGLGSCGDGDRVPWNTYSIGDLADPKGLAPSAFPQTTGCSAVELRVQMVGSAGNAPVRHFRLCFLTPDLQPGSRISSLGGLRKLLW